MFLKTRLKRIILFFVLLGLLAVLFFSTENYIISIKQNPKEGSRAPSRVETPSPSVAGPGPWGPVGSRRVGVSAPGTEPVQRKHQECTQSRLPSHLLLAG